MGPRQARSSEFYLGEKPILKNVPTMCCNKDDLEYTLVNMDLVAKHVHGASGSGILIGPAATQAEIVDFKKRYLPSPTATSRSPL